MPHEPKLSPSDLKHRLELEPGWEVENYNHEKISVVLEAASCSHFIFDGQPGEECLYLDIDGQRTLVAPLEYICEPSPGRIVLRSETIRQQDVSRAEGGGTRPVTVTVTILRLVNQGQRAAAETQYNQAQADRLIYLNRLSMAWTARAAGQTVKTITVTEQGVKIRFVSGETIKLRVTV